MNNTSLDVELIDFLDLINYTLSQAFIEKWKYRFSVKFLKKFQFKVLQGLNKQKKIRKTTLFTFLSKTSGYNPDQVNLFFDSIEIEIYRPFID